MTTLQSLILQGAFIVGIAPFFLGVLEYVSAKVRRSSGMVPWVFYGQFWRVMWRGIVGNEKILLGEVWATMVLLSTALILLVTTPLITSTSIMIGLANVFVVSGVFALGEGMKMMRKMFSGDNDVSLTIFLLSCLTVTLVFSTLAFMTGTVDVMEIIVKISFQHYPVVVWSIIALALLLVVEKQAKPEALQGSGVLLPLTLLHEALWVTVLATLIVNVASGGAALFSVGEASWMTIVVSLTRLSGYLVLAGIISGLLCGVTQRLLRLRSSSLLLLVCATLCAAVGLLSGTW